MKKIKNYLRSKCLFSFANASGLISLAIVVAFFLTGAAPLAIATAPGLGVAESFAILASSTVTNTGNSIIMGDLGLSPGTEVTGFPPGIVLPPGTAHITDAVAAQAKIDATTAYNNLEGQACDFGPFGPTDLAGQTLVPGVYCYSSSVENTGTLTLNGLATDVWVFKVGSTLTTGPGSSVVGSGSKCNIFWQVGSSATLDTTTTFKGTIIANYSISMNNGARLDGRALALHGADTLINNTIDITGCGSVAPSAGVGVFKVFSPSTIEEGEVSTLTITFTNINLTDAALTTAFVDNFPIGVEVADTPNVTTTCGGTGAPVATPGGSSVTLPAGRTIPDGSATAPGFCTLKVDVTASSKGDYLNTIPAAALKTGGGDNASPATALLSVAASPTPTPTPTPIPNPPNLPGTGFKPGVKTILSKQPVTKSFINMEDLWLEIPRLGVQMPIVGIPQTEDGWDVTWLSDQAGWLQGTSFPTWTGNSVLTGHVYDANGNIGPFGHLNWLWYGDQIIVHAWGQQYVYEVRSTSKVTPNSVSSIIKHEDLPWLTLITCSGYDEETQSYQYRIIVSAVQVEIK
ncbi:MAG: sortase [Anaerolineaceae bacterium]